MEAARGQRHAPSGKPMQGQAARQGASRHTIQSNATLRDARDATAAAVPSFKRFVTLAGMAGAAGGRRQWMVNVHVVAEEGQGGAPGRRLVPAWSCPCPPPPTK